jgi:PilZ domain
MSTDPLRIERRQTQRFSFQLPVSVRLAGTEREGYGYTQDLSGRGVLFYTEFPLAEGDAVELTLQMPSEITLAEAMRVRCIGKVTRIIPPAGGTASGVAVHFERYEFLPEAEKVEGSGTFSRVSGLQPDAPRQEIRLGLAGNSTRNSLRP